MIVVKLWFVFMLGKKSLYRIKMNKKNLNAFCTPLVERYTRIIIFLPTPRADVTIFNYKIFGKF